MSGAPSDSPPEEQYQNEEELGAGPDGLIGDVGSEDEDDVQSGTRRKKPDPVPVEDDEEADDLFGDDDDADQAEPAKRQLDDAELDSGDDEGRTDRVQPEDEAETYEERELLAMDMEISRQAVPEPSDGELYLMKIPDFMSIEPQAWQTTTFQPPTTDHHSKKPPSGSFSAFNTAITTIRWRHSPNNPAELQSNARINRWSDGSLTLQFASDPHVQYEIDANSLAPPQRNPLKPTPTAILNAGQKGGGQGTGPGEKYDSSKDAFVYLITPVEQAEALRVAHKVTTGLSLRQTESSEDDAIEKLQAALASAANATKVGVAGGHLEVIDIDPEEQRREAEKSERLLMRDRKRRENAQERERQRTDRAMGRASSGRYGGLNVGMLEDDEMDGGRGRSQPNKARAKPRRRRNSEYSEDEDMGRRRFTKEDSYDQEDDFLAPSDEEEEVIDDEDPDDGIVEETRERTPKRDRSRPNPPAASGGDDDEDAEGEEDDMPQARTKRRRIVDEDEDEE